MMPNATRFSPAVKTEVAMPELGPADPKSSATCCSVRPPAAGKSAAVTACGSAHLLAQAAGGRHLRRRVLGGVSPPPQPANSTATASSTRGSLPIGVSLTGGSRGCARGTGRRVCGGVARARPALPSPRESAVLEPVLADRHADSQVTHGQDVGPVEGEDQEHVRRPLADALDGDQLAPEPRRRAARRGGRARARRRARARPATGGTTFERDRPAAARNGSGSASRISCGVGGRSPKSPHSRR